MPAGVATTSRMGDTAEFAPRSLNASLDAEPESKDDRPMLGLEGRRIAWAILALDVAVLVAAVALLVLNRRLEAPGLFLNALLPLAIGLIYPLLGAVVASRQPRNPIAWILVALGMTMSIAVLGDEYAIQSQLGASGLLPGSGFTAWLQAWMTASFFITGFPLLFLLFPEGRLPSARWKPVLAVIGLCFLVRNALAIFPRGRLTAAFEGVDLRLDNPTGLYDPRALSLGLRVIEAGIWLGYTLVILACVGALVMRLRRAQGVEKQQTKWLAYAAALLVFGLVANLAAGAVGQTTLAQLAFGFAVLTVTFGVPAATVFALLRYHLYGIDLVISRTVLVGGMAAFITLAYLAIVIGFGSLIGLGARPNLALSLVATALIAVAFQPVREWLQQAANRVAYGHRASPYEVLAQFSKQVAASSGAGETLTLVARVLAEGVSASRAEVWMCVDTQLVRVADWPRTTVDARHKFAIPLAEATAIPGADHVAPVEDQNELLGALAVTMPAGKELFPIEVRLLTDLAAHMTVVLRNLGLSAALGERLDDISRQEVELRRSRQEVVMAHDAERRRLERNIHDGAQQYIVAIAIKLRLAANVAASSPKRASRLIEELRSDVRQALAIVGELSSGAYPLVLQEQGLVAALRIQAQQLPLTVTINDQLTGRFDAPVEAAVYFTCLESLQNTTKHARAKHVTVWLGSIGDELVFSVTDDGVGFDPKSVTSGSGLRNMRERLASVAGELSLGAGPRGGAMVSGRVPSTAVRAPA